MIAVHHSYLWKRHFLKEHSGLSLKAMVKFIHGWSLRRCSALCFLCLLNGPFSILKQYNFQRRQKSQQLATWEGEANHPISCRQRHLIYFGYNYIIRYFPNYKKTTHNIKNITLSWGWGKKTSSLRSAWATEYVQVKPKLVSKILSQKQTSNEFTLQIPFKEFILCFKTWEQSHQTQKRKYKNKWRYNTYKHSRKYTIGRGKKEKK